MSILVRNPGRGMAPADALELMEQLEAQLAPDRDTDLAYAMNAIRYLLAREIPAEPKLIKSKKGFLHDTLNCGRCGAGIDFGGNYCWNCGQRINDTYLGRYKTRAEQKAHSSPATRRAIDRLAQELAGQDVKLEDYFKGEAE